MQGRKGCNWMVTVLGMVTIPQKHLGWSYICELSQPTKSQTPTMPKSGLKDCGGWWVGVESNFSVKPPELNKMFTIRGMVRYLYNSALPFRLCLIKVKYTYRVNWIDFRIWEEQTRGTTDRTANRVALQLKISLMGHRSVSSLCFQVEVRWIRFFAKILRCI